ncbi:MAG: carbohydrate kinase [Kiritimatiellae bacterium]|nr:carbohydrate kinase [Kiritimatiellia bacterium]
MATSHEAPADALFLGLDSSTQSLKAMAIDPQANVTHEYAVNFEQDLPEFETKGGCHFHADGLTVTSPPLMWVAALDLLLARMKADGFPFARVAAVSGSGQQHGSVYLRPGTRERLRALAPDQALRDQLADVFAVAESPIWMDSSTTPECRALEDAMGGAQPLADLTGSRAYERFTGNQIAKLYRTQPGAYQATERIALVSSFVASLFIGNYAPLEPGDGAGMNMMALREKTWAVPILDHVAPGLAAKLGPIVPSHTAIGSVTPYFVKRFGFPAGCRVIAFSGDNPCSLAGLRLQHPGDLAVSLGTSDTMFGALSEPNPSANEGHIFGNPIDPDGYMAMVVHKNGAMTREQIRNTHGYQSWTAFEAALGGTPPGNAGNIGFYFTDPEITPPTLGAGYFRFNAGDEPAGEFAAGTDVRAMIESQFLSLRLHGEHIGLRPGMILATGGASENSAIVRVLADVFGIGVYTGEQKNSASLGAAYRALHGWQCAKQNTFVPFAEALKQASPFKKTAEPDPQAHAVYSRMLARYAELETRAVEMANAKNA